MKSKAFWKIYKTTKSIISIIYDVTSILVIVMSFDRIYFSKSMRHIKPWQVARLIERIPRLINNFKTKMRYV